MCVSESVFDFAIMSTSVDFTISTATRRVDVALLVQWEATWAIVGQREWALSKDSAGRGMRGVKGGGGVL